MDNRLNICDKVWGIISLSKLSKTITNHRFFKRLKKIKQLGDLAFSYFNADHTRYEHSIGVAYLAYYTATELQKKFNDISDLEILCVEIAGLCHDIGHGAFSHVFDNILKEQVIKNDNPKSDKKDYFENTHHETRSIIIVKQIFLEINDKKKWLDENYINLICYFIDNDAYNKLIGEPLPHYFKGLEQIVNNNLYKLDVDKMDYIERDAFALNIKPQLTKDLAILDLLKKSLIIGGIWVFDISDQSVIYELFCRRYLFHTNYYTSNSSNIITCMITDAMISTVDILNIEKFIKMETVNEINTFCELTDFSIINTILNNQKFIYAKNLIERIISKKDLYTYAGEFIDGKDEHEKSEPGIDQDTDSVQEQTEGIYCKLMIDDKSKTKNNNKKTRKIINKILYDSSSPLKALPNIIYHNAGYLINPNEHVNVKIIYPYLPIGEK